MSTLLRSTRFAQLRDLAKEGNVEAAGDLWLEFGFQMEGNATNTADETWQFSVATPSDQ